MKIHYQKFGVGLDLFVKLGLQFVFKEAIIHDYSRSSIIISVDSRLDVIFKALQEWDLTAPIVVPIVGSSNRGLHAIETQATERLGPSGDHIMLERRRMFYKNHRDIWL